MKEPCCMCDNARLNERLSDDNDYHCRAIGLMPNKARLMLVSGWGKPLRIEFDEYLSVDKMWHTHGWYFPKFCPECGREVKEYDNERACKN